MIAFHWTGSAVQSERLRERWRSVAQEATSGAAPPSSCAVGGTVPARWASSCARRGQPAVLNRHTLTSERRPAPTEVTRGTCDADTNAFLRVTLLYAAASTGADPPDPTGSGPGTTRPGRRRSAAPSCRRPPIPCTAAYRSAPIAAAASRSASRWNCSMIAVPLNGALLRSQSGAAVPSSHAARSGRPILSDTQPRMSSAYAMPTMSPSFDLPSSPCGPRPRTRPRCPASGTARARRPGTGSS